MHFRILPLSLPCLCFGVVLRFRGVHLIGVREERPLSPAFNASTPTIGNLMPGRTLQSTPAATRIRHMTLGRGVLWYRGRDWKNTPSTNGSSRGGHVICISASGGRYSSIVECYGTFTSLVASQPLRIPSPDCSLSTASRQSPRRRDVGGLGWAGPDRNEPKEQLDSLEPPSRRFHLSCHT